MAKRVVKTFVDDLDNSLHADETVRFSIDGVEREIDLSAENATDLRSVLAPYVNASRRVGGRQPKSAKSTGSSERYDPQAVRRWANKAGVKVNSRGRVRQSVVQQYEASERAGAYAPSATVRS